MIAQNAGEHLLGVTTVYRHFPDEGRCTRPAGSTFFAAHSPPDPTTWSAISAFPTARRRTYRPLPILGSSPPVFCHDQVLVVPFEDPGPDTADRANRCMLRRVAGPLRRSMPARAGSAVVAPDPRRPCEPVIGPLPPFGRSQSIFQLRCVSFAVGRRRCSPAGTVLTGKT